MPVLNNILAGAAGQGGAADYTIERSLRFDKDGAHLHKNFANASNRQTWTYSTWVKRSALGAEQMFGLERQNGNGQGYEYMRFDSQDRIDLYLTHDGSNWSGRLQTEAVFRDVGAWYHVVLVCDITNSTAGDRIRLYVNGERITTFSASGYPATTEQTTLNSTGNHHIGMITGNINYFGGYLAETHFLDGIAISDPDGVFGEFDAETGAWNPIGYTRTGPNDGSTYISSSTLNSGNRGAGAGDSAMFSGTVPTGFAVGGSFGGTAVDPSTTSSSLTINLNKSVSGRVTIYPYFAASAANCSIVFGNGNTVNLSGSELYFGAVDLGVQSSFNSFTINQSFITGGGSNFAIGGIAIDGVLLRDSSTVNTGLNDFYLKFNDDTSNATLGEDSSGNNNDWNVNNIESGAAGNVDASGYVVTSGPASGPNDAGLTFNGKTNNGNYAHGFGTHYVHIDTSSSPIAVNSNDTLTIWWNTSTTNPRDADLQLEFSGGGVTTYSAFTNTGQGSVQSNTITVGTTGSITDIRFGETSSSSPGELHLNAIALNGTYLVSTQPTDSFRDSPTNYEADSGNNGGNFCTWNPLARFTGVAGISSPIVYSEGNLQAKISSGSTWSPGCGTIAVDSGKWYAEFTVTDKFGANHFHVGINPPLAHFTGVTYHSAAGTGHWYGSNGQMWNNGSAGTQGAVATADNGDIIGIALDFDTFTVTFYKNGSTLTSVALNDNIKTLGAVFGFDLYPTCAVIANFGQRPFSHPVSGFKALCTQNIEAPIEKSSKEFDIAIWDGDSANSRTIPTDHEPEFVWVKNRTVDGRSHYLYDAVRGFGANKELVTNQTYEEGSSAHSTQNHGYVSGTTSTGFTLAAGATNSNYTNQSGQSYAGWAWNCGEPTTNSAYNQDRVWSDGVTFSGTILEPAVKAFDGNPNTSAAPYDAAGGGGTPQYVEVTFSPGLPYTSSVRVERQNGNPTGYTVSMNGGTPINSPFQQYTTVATGSGTLTSIKVQNNGASNTAGISRIEVDGKVLVDKGVVPVGSLNDSVYDQSQTWSTAVDTTGSATINTTNHPISNAFDGTLISSGTDYAGTVAGDQNQLIFGFSSGFLDGKLVEVYIGNNPATTHQWGLDGTNWADQGSTRNGWITLGTGTSTSKVYAICYGSGNGAYIAGIRVDGKILVDYGVTPPNLPLHACSQRANPTAGFSILNYLGANSNISISHGLSKPPEFIVIKSRDSTQPWVIGHKDIGWTHYLHFSNAIAAQLSTVWQDTEPTSSVFTVGATGGVNAIGENMLALCWHGVEGFSKFGSYIGTGGSPGTFQYTGFKVRFLWLKTVDGGAANWYMYDTERDLHNVTDRNVIVNSSGFEGTTSNKMDFYSNGFVPRSSGTSSNVSGRKYIWCAFADNPLKYARAH